MSKCLNRRDLPFSGKSDWQDGEKLARPMKRKERLHQMIQFSDVKTKIGEQTYSKCAQITDMTIDF